MPKSHMNYFDVFIWFTKVESKNFFVWIFKSIKETNRTFFVEQLDNFPSTWLFYVVANFWVFLTMFVGQPTHNA